MLSYSWHKTGVLGCVRRYPLDIPPACTSKCSARALRAFFCVLAGGAEGLRTNGAGPDSSREGLVSSQRPRGFTPARRLPCGHVRSQKLADFSRRVTNVRSQGESMKIVQCAAMALVFACGHSHAAYTLNFVQSGPDVVATGSGSINTSGATFAGNTISPAVIIPNLGMALVGTPPSSIYAITTLGPADYGSGAGILSSSTTGDAAGITSGAWIGVPVGYVSGAPLAPSTTTWAGTTMAALGLTPGSYTWTWGAGPTADSFTIVVASTASIPTLSEWAMLLMSGLLAAGALVGLRRRQR